MDVCSRLLPCVAVALLTLQCFTGVQAATWSYSGADGVDAWAKNYATCGGKRQSPIDLTSDKVKYDSTLAPFTFSNFDNVSGVTWSVTNNGHTVAVTYASGDLTVSGGSLGGTYKVYAFHWHWGSNDSLGSEHTVDKKFYPMEIHIVTYNTKYADFTDCLNKTDGLAVLGVFYEVKEGNTSAIEIITGALQDSVKYPGNVTTLTPIPLTLLIPSSYRSYYRYGGSLTTPSCNEIVTWTVFQNTMPITIDQLEKFRKLIDSHGHELENNFRPVQPLNDREIKSSFPMPTSSAALAHYSFMLLLSSLLPLLAQL